MTRLANNRTGLFEKYFYPDRAFSSIYSIDLDELYASGIRCLIVDIDNTLAKPGAREPDERAVRWLNAVRDMGFDVCMLSNATRGRVAAFASGFGIFAISGACKPAGRGFEKAFRLLGCEPSRACVIGDQIFTDVWGGKRLGAATVYTVPVTRWEGFGVMLKRIPEFFVIRGYKKYLRRAHVYYNAIRP